MRAVLAGLGAVEALEGHGEGTILASFPRVVYVATPAGIAAFVAPGVQPGPLHVLLDTAPTPEVARIELDGAKTWRGAVPEAAALAGAAQLLRTALDPVAARNQVPERRAAAAQLALDRGDLAAVAGHLGGAGPGLTPAGDDALGGILFALRALGTGQSTGLEGVARSVETTTISAAFLLWAARGQALAPVHDLLGAAVAGDMAGARSAATALGAVGHSSGADFAQGLCWGLSQAVATG